MASMKDIKTRIRSVESTQQITRAMELVATSKLRHARERVERSRPFHEVLGEAIAGIQAGLKETPSVYSEVRPSPKICSKAVLSSCSRPPVIGAPFCKRAVLRISLLCAIIRSRSCGSWSDCRASSP